MKGEFGRGPQPVKSNRPGKFMALASDQCPSKTIIFRCLVLEEVDDFVAVGHTGDRQRDGVSVPVLNGSGISADLFSRPQEKHSCGVARAERFQHQPVGAEGWRRDHDRGVASTLLHAPL